MSEHTPGIGKFGHEILTKRQISHDEADAAVQRLVNSHFDNRGEHGRMSIPANPDRDDDLVLSAYITQQRANGHLIAAAPQMAEDNKRLRELNAELLEALHAADEAITGHFEDECEICRDKREIIRAAIAKATGGK